MTTYSGRGDPYEPPGYQPRRPRDPHPPGYQPPREPDPHDPPADHPPRDTAPDHPPGRRRRRSEPEPAEAPYPPESHYPPVYVDPGPPESRAWELLLVPVLAGALVALTLGIYGNMHEGTGVAVNLAGFADHPAPTSAVKVTLGTGAVLFAVLQIGSALAMFGRIPVAVAPELLDTVHRWSGRVAFLLAVPVAVHCLYAAGFQTFDTRVFVHSLLGCLFFGAFVVKMLGLRRDGLPGWFLPTIGGAVFTGLIGLWWTTAIRFFNTFGSPF